jgi:ATP-dependent metalloprotease FtsH
MQTQTRFHEISADRVSAPVLPAVVGLGQQMLFGCTELTGAAMAFERNVEVYGEGEASDYVYKVISGTVRTYRVLSDGRRQISGFHLSGDVFGIEFGEEHSCSAEAVVDSSILVVRRSLVFKMAERNSEVARRLWSLTATELQRSQQHVGVILLAATNRPEILDPALLRAGRFDRQVLVDRPDRKGRLDILKVHVRKVQLAPGLNLDAVAGLTTGFTGADIANLVNEAAIIATRRNGIAISLDDFTAAIERIVAGLEKKSRVLNADERRRVAYHEMGHALVASSLPGVDHVLKVSIIPRGVGALGYTIQRLTEDRFLLAESDLENRIAVLMGGRAAESLIFSGNISTGAADDLQRATEIALEMVTRHGMNEKIGQRTYAPTSQSFLYGVPAGQIQAAEATEREIDIAVRDIMAKAFERASEILTSRRPDLEKGVALLLAQETVTADQLPEIRPHIPALDQRPTPAAQQRPDVGRVISRADEPAGKAPAH